MIESVITWVTRQVTLIDLVDGLMGMWVFYGIVFYKGRLVCITVSAARL